MTYCACANEMTAARASVDLAAKGIPGAKALKGGWDEWVQRGEKIEKLPCCRDSVFPWCC